MPTKQKHGDSKSLLGQVGGFPLRLSWLPRAYAQYGGTENVPRNPEDIALELGIGKNMAKSLRVWGLASGMLNEQSQITQIAHKLFAEDAFLEQVDSIALLHWLICSNQKRLTANAWLFGHFNAGMFTVKQAVHSFRSFLAARGASYAEGTVKVDIETALRMYTSVHERTSNDLDDMMFYPLGLFSVRRIDGTNTYSRTWASERALVSARVLRYAVLATMASRQIGKANFGDLYSSDSTVAGPGVVFGYSQEGFYLALERLMNSSDQNFKITALPGGDFEFEARKSWAKKCIQGDPSLAADVYFGTAK